MEVNNLPDRDQGNVHKDTNRTFREKSKNPSFKMRTSLYASSQRRPTDDQETT